MHHSQVGTRVTSSPWVKASVGKQNNLNGKEMYLYQDLVPLSHCRGLCPSPPVQLVPHLIVLLHLGDETTGRHELLIQFIGLRLAITCGSRVKGPRVAVV